MGESPKFLKMEFFCQPLMLYKRAYSDFPQKRLSVAVTQRTFTETWYFSTLCLIACNYWTSKRKKLKSMSKKFSKSFLFVFKISIKSAKLLKSYSKSKLFNLKRTPDRSSSSTKPSGLLNFFESCPNLVFSTPECLHCFYQHSFDSMEARNLWSHWA